MTAITASIVLFIFANYFVLNSVFYQHNQDHKDRKLDRQHSLMHSNRVDSFLLLFLFFDGNKVLLFNRIITLCPTEV